MKRFLVLFLTFSILFASVTFAEGESAGNRIEIFVDNKVEQSGDGSMDAPYKTIDEAQKRVREIVASSDYPEGGVVVFLREGQYKLSDTIYFDEQDSGKEGAPVVWRAYYNEDVTISNGAEIPLSDFTYSDDSRIPESAQGKVMSYNLKENGIAGYDGLYLAGHSQHYYWVAGMAEPDAIQFGYPVPEVFFGEETGRLAEYPNDNGWLGITELVDRGTKGWFRSDFDVDKLDSWVGATLKVDVDQARMKRWENAKNPWYDSYWAYDWSDFRAPFEKIDSKKQTIKTKHALPWEPNVQTARWRIYNLIEELDAPGEWFYDEDNGELYVFPPAGVRSDTMITLAFQKKNIFEIDNAHDIVIRNLNLKGTRFSGVYAENSKRLEVAYCKISELSSNGVVCSLCEDCYIHGNIIKNVGAKGIAVAGGDKETLTPSGILVENNYITNFARVQKAYIAAVDVNGVGVQVRNNTMSDAAQTAVTYGGNDHLFERNDIYDVAKEASDMGACYRLADRGARGTVWENNAFHDLKSDTKDSIGIFAIYFDGGAPGDIARGNVFYNIKGGGVFMNCGRALEVYDNIFANVSEEGVMFACVGQEHAGMVQHTLETAEGKEDNPAYDKYPDFKYMFTDPDTWRTTKACVVKDNIGYNTPVVARYTTGGTSMTEEKLHLWNVYEEGTNYTEDPGFLSLDNNNYTLTDTSKVYDLYPSFKDANIDMSKMGTLTGMWEHYLGDNSVVFKNDSVLSYVDFEEKLLQNPLKLADNTTYIPLRYAYEGMDYSVTWNHENNAVNIASKLDSVDYQIDSAECVLNGENKTLKHKILFENGVTYISVEDFAEVTGISLYTTDDGLYIFSEKDLSGVIYDDMLKDLRERLAM